MKLKTPKILMFLLLLAFASASGAQTTNKIGFVSLDRILRDAAPAVRAQKKIEAEFSKRDQELQRGAEQLAQRIEQPSAGRGHRCARLSGG